MALDPMSLERFVQLSQEEGVPLEVSVPFFVLESSTGGNKEAYMLPSERAGKGNFANTTADGIGYGPLQVIQSTYKGIMGKDAPYETASVEDLTRAGLRNLKSKAEPDGSYDLTKVMKGHFGPGVDKSFSKDGKPYIPSEAKAPEVLSIANAIINAKLSGEDYDVAKLIKDTGTQHISPQQAPVFVKQAQISDLSSQIDAAEREVANANVSGDSTRVSQALQVQGELARQKQSAMYEMLMGISNANADQNSQILDAFKQNPAGVFASLAKSAETISTMQDRLNTEVAYANMEFQSENSGFAGFLETAFKNFAGKMNAPRTAASLKQITDAQAQVNQAVSGAMENASKGQINPNTAINAMNAATSLARFEFDTSKAAANAELKIQESERKAAQAQAQAAFAQQRLETQTAITKSRLEAQQAQQTFMNTLRSAGDERKAKAQEADLRLKEAKTVKLQLQNENILKYGSKSSKIQAIESFQDYNKHIEKINEVNVANGETPWPLIQSEADFKASYLQNKPRMNRLLEAMNTGNYSMAGRTFSEAYRNVIGKLTLPEQDIARNLAQKFDRNKVYMELDQADPKFRGLEEKQKQARIDSVISANLDRTMKAPRVSSNFNNDVRNLGINFARMVEINAPESIKQTFNSMGISIDSLDSDMKFFSQVAYGLKLGKIQVPREQLQEDIATMYKNHVATAAKQDSVFSKLGIRLPSKSYPITDKLGGKVTSYDLTEPFYVQEYLDKAMSLITDWNFGQTIPGMKK